MKGGEIMEVVTIERFTPKDLRLEEDEDLPDNIRLALKVDPRRSRPPSDEAMQLAEEVSSLAT